MNGIIHKTERKCEMDRKLRDNRNKLIVKSNELIRNARYSLSELEQKFIVFLISKIEKNDKELKEVTINLKEYCNIAGLEYSGGSIAYIKNNIQELSNKSWWIDNLDGSSTLFRWIDTVSIYGETIKIILSESLKPYLIDLKQDFSKYELINILVLRGKYTVRLYELFKSYSWKGEWRVKVKELRNIINCDKYKQFKEFNRNVLKYSIEEINKHTDLNISYKTIREGKFVNEIEFLIKEKEGFQMTIEMIMNQEERLDSNEK